MKKIINDKNLTVSDIDEFKFKTRAILINDDNKILVVNYGDVVLLPGGAIDEDETVNEAIIRELKEETGEKYNDDELNYMATIQYFQDNYPKMDGSIKNRLVQIYCFVGTYKGLLLDEQKLSEREKSKGFKLELMSLEELENYISLNKNDNPRNAYFQKELLELVKIYKENREEFDVKRLKLEK